MRYLHKSWKIFLQDCWFNTYWFDFGIHIFQALSWPIASQLQLNEEMEIQVLAFNRFLNNRLLGSAQLSLQRLLDESQIQLALSLIDINGRPLKVGAYTVRTYLCRLQSCATLRFQLKKSNFSYQTKVAKNSHRYVINLGSLNGLIWIFTICNWYET